MPKRASLHVRKMEILQFTLLASDIVSRGRTQFFAIHSNRFNEPWEFDEGVVGWENGKDITRKRIEKGPTRKIFRTYLPQLLKEKLLVKIKTNDNRSKYYSITPLGIIHLIKSNMFFDLDKYPHPERDHVILTLQAFASPNVKPYRSVVFEDNQFFNHKIQLLEDIFRFCGIGFRHQVAHVFSNVDIVQEDMQSSKFYINYLEFFVTNGFSDINKHRLAIFDLDEKSVKVEELDKSLLNSFSHNEEKEYHGLELDDEQFHHYLANLMLCSLIYDSVIADFDRAELLNNLLPKLKKKNPHLQKLKYFMEKKTDNVPEYFLRILFLFSKHILKLTENQYKLTSNFNGKLNSLQFKQTKVSKPQLMN